MALAWNVAKSHQLSIGEKIILFNDFDRVLGLALSLIKKEEIVLTEEQNQLVKYREHARKIRHWSEADRIRIVLLSQGIQVKDTAKGTEISFVIENNT